MAVEQPSRCRVVGEVLGEGLRQPLQLDSTSEVGTNAIGMGLLTVDRIESGSTHAMQEAVEDHQHQLVFRWSQLIKGAS